MSVNKSYGETGLNYVVETGQSMILLVSMFSFIL